MKANFAFLPLALVTVALMLYETGKDVHGDWTTGDSGSDVVRELIDVLEVWSLAIATSLICSAGSFEAMGETISRSCSRALSSHLSPSKDPHVPSSPAPSRISSAARC